MKILFCIRSLDLAGAEKQLVLLANGLAERGHTVSVAVGYSGGVLEASLKNVELVHLGKKGRWDISFLCRFLAHVRRFSPDVVHGYLGLGNMLAALSKPLTKNAAVVWGVRASNMDLAQYDSGARLSFHLERFLSRFADAIIANSVAGREHAVHVGYPAEVLHVVHNGIDTAVYRPEPEMGHALRRELGMGEREVLFGLVGRVDVMKGHDIFLKAASVVAERFPDARFLCVGRAEGPFADGVRAKAETLPGLAGKVHWLPARKDLLPVYGALDGLVSASRFGEGFSNVLGEAMACGVGCLATDVGDSREIVGETGLIVPPEDPEALARGMETFFTPEGVVERADRSRRRIESLFSIERLVSSTESILAALRGGNGQ